MNIPYKQYEDVELTHDMMSDALVGEPVMLREGQEGVILEIYTEPRLGYDVEFFDNEGNTVAVMIMEDQDIRPRRTGE